MLILPLILILISTVKSWETSMATVAITPDQDAVTGEIFIAARPRESSRH
jgi:hypothetical protein